MNARPQPFRLSVDEAAIADLRERLARTRFPDQAPGEHWAYCYVDDAFTRHLPALPGEAAPIHYAPRSGAALRL